jgi:hypothetical protein
MVFTSSDLHSEVQFDCLQAICDGHDEAFGLPAYEGRPGSDPQLRRPPLPRVRQTEQRKTLRRAVRRPAPVGQPLSWPVRVPCREAYNWPGRGQSGEEIGVNRRMSHSLDHIDNYSLLMIKLYHNRSILSCSIKCVEALSSTLAL